MGYCKSGSRCGLWVGSCGRAAGDSEVVNSASQEHDRVLKTRLGVAVNVGHDMTAFDSGNGVFDSDPQTRNGA
jgi:hypothetical protein